MTRHLLSAIALVAGVLAIGGLIAASSFTTEGIHRPSVGASSYQPGPTPPLPTGTRPPNVLFVVWDTVRADRLSVYGHDKNTTPFLASIASKSAVFDQAISPSFWTLPSHASLFTGLSVTSHGANAGYKWLDGRFITVAEHFRDNGYDTYAWSSNPNINRSANTIQGFDTFHQPFGHNSLREQVEEATKALLHPEDETTRPDPERYKNISHHKAGAVTHDAFTGWLSERNTSGTSDKPFFAFINYMEAHAYRLPSEAARRAVLTDPRAYHRALKTPNLLKRQTNVMHGNWKPYTRSQREGLYDLYDASIWDLDHYLKGLFDDLEARGVLDNTVIVVTSDHGEQFGEHGLYLHNFSIYQPLVHVPLVIYGPRVDPSRTTEPVSTAAIFHTLVQLSGVPAPDAPILAHDLLHDAPGAVVAELDVPCAHPENRRLDTSIRDWSATYRSVSEGVFKLIDASNGQHELYDIAADPREVTNLYVEGDPVVKRLRGHLMSWVAAQPIVTATDGERDAEVAAREAEVDDELMQQLEELGYVGD